MEHLLSEHFRCAEPSASFILADDLSCDSGYFRFGSDAICYGQCSSGSTAQSAHERLHDASEHVKISDGSLTLPFDPLQVVDSLRRELYVSDSRNRHEALPGNAALRKLYYAVRPAMGVGIRKHLQRTYFRQRTKTSFPQWPVDTTIEAILERLLIFAMKSRNIKRLPFIWFWPDGAKTCTVLTHDVETEAGLRFSDDLMDLDDSFGIKASFPIIPEERYSVSQSLLDRMRKRGFEIVVHDLNHDGHLFSDRDEFMRRAKRINHYGHHFRASGFRSGAMYRNVDWFDSLEFSYDMSIPNVAHLDPQKGGCCTVFPFFVGDMVELPVTTTQDYSLLHILGDYSTRLWQQQISRIREKHGMISVVIHPDYTIEKSARRIYTELLQFLCEMRTRGETWVALSGEAASWWRLRSNMNLVRTRDSWRIVGKGSKRARLAYAVLNNDALTFQVDDAGTEALVADRSGVRMLSSQAHPRPGG